MHEPDYLKPYADATRQAGARFEALLWQSAEAQQLRFDILVDLCTLNGRVIADIGCGLADLAKRLDERRIRYGRYVGVEGVPGLAIEAKARIGRDQLEDCYILEADFVAQHDLFLKLVRESKAEVFVFSGSLNTLPQSEAMMVLGRAWDAVRTVRGGQLAFNFLSTRTDRPPSDTGPANRFDPAQLVAWALERTSLVTLRHDYWEGHDATIHMSRH